MRVSHKQYEQTAVGIENLKAIHSKVSIKFLSSKSKFDNS
jgi:hypothetical protein